MADDNAAKECLATHVTDEQIRNAELLLTYASETGITLPHKTIENIVRLKHASDSASTPVDPVELETSFLQATESLAKAVSPVTVASLRASYDQREDTSLVGRVRRILGAPKQVTLASLSVRRFRSWALVTLLLLLIVQTYWVVGSSVTDDVTTTLKQVETDKSKIALLQREAKAIDDQLEKRNGQGVAPTADNTAGNVQLEEELGKKQNEISIIAARLDNYEQSTELNFEILNNWNEYWRRPIQFFGRIIGSPAQRSEKNDTAEPYQRLLKSQKTAQFAIYALQIYLLPILYGLLGAITYVLRTLAVQIKSLTYTPESDIFFRLRMNLGALSGLAIVWFIKEGSEAQLPFSSLSQFAIAFIAGYSVELLFAAMDRFISAFSGNPKETA